MSEATEPFTVASHRGPYEVGFLADDLGQGLGDFLPRGAHLVVDARVADLYRDALADVVEAHPAITIQASEEAKSLSEIPGYIEELLALGVRRDGMLVAIGGGVIQDITCFIAAVLMRGVSWSFVPTTLLAQADSCIGSKSSINVSTVKNVVGTFTPPERVLVAPEFLGTLDEVDVRSGIGEMLKVHAIDGPEAFDEIAEAYDRLSASDEIMAAFIRRSLMIKKEIIEEDEFDQDRRAVMNFGHTFGHAIEAATAFAVPHGIAVTMGIDMANWVAAALDPAIEPHRRRMEPALQRNYTGFEDVDIPVDAFLSAIRRDKKNVGQKLRLILLQPDGRPEPVLREADDTFLQASRAFLEQLGEAGG